MTAFAQPASWPAQAGHAHRLRTVPRRLPNEFYPTPPEATRALLSVEDFDGDIWEPACGDGRIAKVLTEHGYAVVSTDLHAYGHGETGVDFLAQRMPLAKHIVTNPPYGRGLADRFVSRALALTRETGGKVAMLLNMASLCHPRRTRLVATDAARPDLRHRRHRLLARGPLRAGTQPFHQASLRLGRMDPGA